MKIKTILLFFCLLKAGSAYNQQSVEDSLNKIIALGKEDITTAKAYNGLAYEYSRKDAVKTRAYLNAAIAIGKKLNDPKLLSGSYAYMVYLEHDAGKPDSAEYYLGLIKDLVAIATDEEKERVNSNYFAVTALYYKRTGNYQKAIPFFEKAIETNINIGDKESQAGQTLNLGNTYVALGNYEKAMEQHLKALKVFEELGESRGISFCYQSLSKSFAELKQYDKALLYGNKSLKLKIEIKDKQGIASTRDGLGEIYFGMKDYAKALFHYKQALNTAKELQNMLMQQEYTLHIAKVYATTKDVKLAEAYFNQSKAFAKQLKDSSSVAAIETELIALQSAKYTVNAEDQLNTSIKLFEERGDLIRQANSYKNMADFYIKNKDFEKALEYNNKYHGLTDSLRNTDLQLQVLNMEEGYNSAKKENEIQLLKKDKELQQQKLFRQRILYGGALILLLVLITALFLFINRNRLRQRMKELEIRNHIAADLHDEVGSSLSSIKMLSEIASQQKENNGHLDEILEKINVNAKETAEKMHDIIWMINPKHDQMKNILQRMEKFLYEMCSHKNIQFEFIRETNGTLKLNMQQRKDLLLIFKEAVNNAVKYAEAKKITTTLTRHQQQLILTVKDNGKGFDIHTIQPGNGLDSMQMRANELKGSITIISEPSSGTEISVFIPL